MRINKQNVSENLFHDWLPARNSNSSCTYPRGGSSYLAPTHYHHRGSGSYKTSCGKRKKGTAKQSCANAPFFSRVRASCVCAPCAAKCWRATPQAASGTHAYCSCRFIPLNPLWPIPTIIRQILCTMGRGSPRIWRDVAVREKDSSCAQCLVQFYSNERSRFHAHRVTSSTSDSRAQNHGRDH
jgi:hypothetical protein